MHQSKRILVDLIPSLLFYITFIATDLYFATIILMLTSVVVIVLNKKVFRKSSVVLYFSSGAVLLFGGLTIFSGDTRFIKMKPTFVYTTLATVLLVDQYFKNSKLRVFLSTMIPVKDHDLKFVTKAFAFFWLVLAVLNEIVWRNFDDHTWMLYKTFGLTILNTTFIGAIYLLKFRRA